MPRTLTSSMHTGMFDEMSRAVDRLALNDASVTVRREAKARPTLGAGLRLGFLGLLHLDVFRQRLRDEFGAEVLFTSPTVPYKVRWKDGNVTTLEALDDWPDAAQLSREVSDILEPVVDLEVVTPREHVTREARVSHAGTPAACLDRCRTERHHEIAANVCIQSAHAKRAQSDAKVGVGPRHLD